MTYKAILERGKTSWGAYVPELPGCVAVADSRERVTQLIREAVEFHVEALRERGEPVPPDTSIEVVDAISA